MELVIVLLAAMAVVIVVACLRESRRALESQLGLTKQPATSDAEFCELMPEIDPELALKVRNICSDVSGWDPDEIHPQTRLVEFEIW